MSGFSRSFQFCGQTLACADTVHLMGIVNVTPDSFSDGGRFASVDAAVAQGLALAAAGAAILDVGGESTRPGYDAVEASEEIKRVLPVIKELKRQTSVPISIDTTKAAVARKALEAGAVIVNDVSGMEKDQAEMAALLRQYRAGCVVMHAVDLTANQQAQGLAAAIEVKKYLENRIRVLVELTGLDRSYFAIDPGIGFGKDCAQNVALIRHLSILHSLDCAVLLGPSRKRFLGHLTGVADPAARDWGTAAAVAAGIMQGADLIRVHEVEPMRDVAAVAKAIAKSK